MTANMMPLEQGFKLRLRKISIQGVREIHVGGVHDVYKTAQLIVQSNSHCMWLFTHEVEGKTKRVFIDIPLHISVFEYVTTDRSDDATTTISSSG